MTAYSEMGKMTWEKWEKQQSNLDLLQYVARLIYTSVLHFLNTIMFIVRYHPQSLAHLLALGSCFCGIYSFLQKGRIDGPQGPLIPCRPLLSQIFSGNQIGTEFEKHQPPSTTTFFIGRYYSNEMFFGLDFFLLHEMVVLSN